MSNRTSTPKVARIAALLAALWLWLPQSARAGDGGDLAGINNYLMDTVCGTYTAITQSQINCPQLPTLTQAVLQVSAFLDLTPEAVRGGNSVLVGAYVDAGNPSRPPALAYSCTPQPPATTCTPPADPLDPISAWPIVDTGVLSTLRPLAFVHAASSTGSATPTQLYD